MNQLKLYPSEPAPAGFAPSPTKEQLDEMQGMYLLNGNVRLLTAPAWNDEHKRWQALADVGGRLCVIQVNIKVNDIPCHGEL